MGCCNCTARSVSAHSSLSPICHQQAQPGSTMQDAHATVRSRQCASRRDASRAAGSAELAGCKRCAQMAATAGGWQRVAYSTNGTPKPLCQTRSKIQTRTLLCVCLQPPDSSSVQLLSARETDVVQRYMTSKLFSTFCLPASTACRRRQPPDLPTSGWECLQVRAADCARLRCTERPRISRGCGSPAPWRC